MHTWRRPIGIAAVLVAGCTGTIDIPGGGGAPGDPDSPGGPGGNIDGGANGHGPGGTLGPGGTSPNPFECIPGIPATSQLPRLTRSQYANTVRDLFGINSQASSLLGPDSTGSVDDRAWNGYQSAAATVAAEVMADPGARGRVITCASQDATCAEEVIRNLGKKAFRRPITDEDVARFMKLYEARAEITPNGTFDEAVGLLVEAFLVSPSFLMRAETAEANVEEGYFQLSPHEVATRLSYMLWGTMPDDILLAAADAGELSEPAKILEQAQRMLGDERARAMVRAFHNKYLHMGPGTRWTEVVRDQDVYPAFNPSLVPLLSEETDRFVDHIAFNENGTFQDLLTSPVGFVNADLAPLYDLDPSQFGSELQAANLDPTVRSGVLTRLGFLAAHAAYDRTSPILRGAFVQLDVLCANIGTPPPDAEGQPLGVGDTNRERVDGQTDAPACRECHHNYINPAGFALEAYDAVGAYQETEWFSGAPINTAVSVRIGTEMVDVGGPVEFSEVIAEAPEAHTCYARHWVKFAYQRDITNQDSCTVEEMQHKLTEGGYTILDLVKDLTQSPSFRYRALETEVAP